MNKMDLIATVADGTDLSRAKAGEVVDAVFDAITGALKNKEEVRLVGFGTFAAAVRKAKSSGIVDEFEPLFRRALELVR